MMLNKILLLQLFLVTNIYCQTDISSLSASLGIIRNLQLDNLNNFYSLYTEIEIGGKFIDSTTSWYLFLNYFDDHVTEIKPVRDLDIFYSYKNYGVGLKIYVTVLDLSKIDLPFIISISGGASLNYVEGKNILDSPYSNFSNVKYKYDHIYNLGIGLRTQYSLTEIFDLIAEYSALIMLSNKTNSYAKYRSAVKFGVSMKF